MSRCEKQCPKCSVDPTLAASCCATLASVRGQMPEHEHACARDHRWSTSPRRLGGGLPRELKAQADLVRKWTFPIGTPVDVHKGNGAFIRTKTSSGPSLLGGHTAVIHVEGLQGAYLLERVKALDEKRALAQVLGDTVYEYVQPGTVLKRRRVSTPKPAIVTVRAVTVECPICHERVDSEEGERLHTECVSAQPGVITCANCEQRFAVPDLSTVFRRIAPKRAR